MKQPAQFVGKLGDVDVWIHVINGDLTASTLVDHTEGVEVYLEANRSWTKQQRIDGLLKGMHEAAKGERYELAIVARNTLAACGIDPATKA